MAGNNGVNIATRCPDYPSLYPDLVLSDAPLYEMESKLMEPMVYGWAIIGICFGIVLTLALTVPRQ